MVPDKTVRFVRSKNNRNPIKRRKRCRLRQIGVRVICNLIIRTVQERFIYIKCDVIRSCKRRRLRIAVVKHFISWSPVTVMDSYAVARLIREHSVRNTVHFDAETGMRGIDILQGNLRIFDIISINFHSFIRAFCKAIS